MTPGPVDRAFGSAVGSRVAQIARRVIGARIRERLPHRAKPDPELHEPPLVMGRHSYVAPEIIGYRGDTGRVVIGAFCSIADGCKIFLGGNHHMHTVSTYPLRMRWNLPNAIDDGMPSTKGDVHIGNDCWIGREAMILSGVAIGDGAVIGARAVVTRDVRPYAVVAGNPAREVRRRFDDAAVEALLLIKWWNWDDDVILARIDDLNRDSVDEFIARYGRGQ